MSLLALLVPKSLRAMVDGRNENASAKIIPGVDRELLIKDAGKLMPDPTRRTVPARRAPASAR